MGKESLSDKEKACIKMLTDNFMLEIGKKDKWKGMASFIGIRRKLDTKDSSKMENFMVEVLSTTETLIMSEW
jgi:hypothetical protein